MTETFPRLLVATEFSPNAPGGGPAVVRQMLKGWPVDKLFWWGCLHEVDQKIGQKVAAHAVAAIPRKLYPHRRWGPQKSWVLENFWTRWAAAHFSRTLKSFRPEVVWVIPHGWSIPPIAQVLAEVRMGCHVSIHDYADCGSCVRSFGRPASLRLLKRADRLYAEATTCDAICQAMAEDLRRRTGRAGGIARAGLEAEDFDFLRTAPAGPGAHLRIAYAGTILVEEAFASFVAALKEIRAVLPRPLTLVFFGNHSYRSRAWFDPDWMQEYGNLAAAELAAALKECDWGFSPMSLTDEDPQYNRFSLPTKFVSYLAAGLPAITLGHPESSVVKMARAHDVGVCLATPDVKLMAAQLAAALTEDDPKAKYRAAIQQCALEEFDTRRMRAWLHECFRNCAQITRGDRS